MVFDTLYRRRLAPETAFAEIEREQGKQFDPDIATAFLQIRDKVLAEMQRFEN